MAKLLQLQLLFDEGSGIDGNGCDDVGCSRPLLQYTLIKIVVIIKQLSDGCRNNNKSERKLLFLNRKCKNRKYNNKTKK